MDRARVVLWAKGCVVVFALLAPRHAMAASPALQPKTEPDVFGGHASTHIVVRLTPTFARDHAGRGRASLKGTARRPPPAMSPGLQATWTRWGATGMRPFYPYEFQNPELAAKYGLDRIYMIDVPRGTDTPAMAAAFVAHHDEIEQAGVDTIGGVAQLLPDDEDFDRLYNMHNTGQTGGLVDADIDAPEAWELHTGDYGTVTIAIIDSGVSPHPEYQDRMVPGRNTVFDADPNDTSDDCPHGTHVAGIAAAEGNNAAGVAGVTWGANIMPVRVLTGCGGTPMDMVSGIIWATDNGADIGSISLQFYNLYPSVLAALENAVNYAHDQGVLLIAAAGNNRGGVVAYPGKLENCMAVSATTDDDLFADRTTTECQCWSSNWGNELDVCAPGDNIWSTWIGGQYYMRFGTSMATPLVSGVAALTKSLVPELTNDEIKQILVNTVDDLGPEGWDNLYGHGRINAYKVLAAAVGGIISSVPYASAIDARVPHEPNDPPTRHGWSSVELTFPEDVSGLVPEDFTVTQEGGAAGAPAVAAVLPIDTETVSVELDDIIEVSAWTTITHDASGTSVRLGYLPGDVNASGGSAPSDILALIDALNNVGGVQAIWSLDVDRSGDTGPDDVLRLIDLLTGAAGYDTFLGAMLP